MTNSSPNDSPTKAADLSYLHERLLPLGWSEEKNTVRLPAHATGDNRERSYPLFEADAEGNLLINYFSPTGQKSTYRRGDNKWAKDYQVIRWRTVHIRADGAVEKYKHPYGAPTRPWFSPNLIDAVNEGCQLDTIVMTEGVLKAYAASLHGAYMIGLPGIHNLKEKAAGTLHTEVLHVLKACKPQQVIFLHDGDCHNLTGKWPGQPNVDLYTRPNSFFTSARNMGELLKDHARSIGFRSWYMHVDSASIPLLAKMEAPKGLDDLMLAYAEVKVHEAGHRVTKDSPISLPPPEKQEEIRFQARQAVVDDLTAISSTPRYFQRMDLDRPSRLRDYFHLKSAETFHAAHQEDIDGREFVYDGTKYQWNEQDNTLEVKVPSVARKYVRVGGFYYKYVKVPNPHNGKLEERLDPWKKGEITEDHGGHFITHIPKYDSFVNYPDHIAYRDVMHNCLNSYAPFEHVPDTEADEPAWTLRFLRHIFGTGTVTCPHPKQAGTIIQVNELDLGLDYLKLLYERPVQMLPILCLVSKERGTGKTTFFDWLGLLFGANATQIGAKDLEGDFNKHYASKLIAIIDEALISKQESVEKLKHLSTSRSIMVNEKGVTQRPQSFFGKFLLGSNNIRTFIRTDDDEVRFWVRRIPKLPDADVDTDLLGKMEEEIPAFLGYLAKRQFATERLFRSWFWPPLMVTAALEEVRKSSTPTALRSIESWVRDVFYAKPELQEILMTVKDIKREVFPGSTRVDEKYIGELLVDGMGLLRYTEGGQQVTTRYSYWRPFDLHDADGVRRTMAEVKSTYPQRPFVLPRRLFLADEDVPIAPSSAETHEPKPLPF